MSLRSLLIVCALVAAAAAATPQKTPKSDQIQKEWAARIADSLKNTKAAGAAVLKGLTGERLTGVQRALDWLNKYTYPKIFADLTNFAGLLRLESLQVERGQAAANKKKILAAWGRYLTSLQQSDRLNMKTTLDALVVRLSGVASGAQIHNVRVALSTASVAILKNLESEQKLNTALLKKQVALFA